MPTATRLASTSSTAPVAAPFTGTSAKGAAVNDQRDGSFSYDPTGAAALHRRSLPIGSQRPRTRSPTRQPMGTAGPATATATITVTVGGHPPTAPTSRSPAARSGTLCWRSARSPRRRASRSSAVGSDGILSHASDPDVGDSITVTAFDATSAQGGNVSVDGATRAFTYRPKAGFTGTDCFHYTVVRHARGVGNRDDHDQVSRTWSGTCRTTRAARTTAGPARRSTRSRAPSRRPDRRLATSSTSSKATAPTPARTPGSR